MVQQGFVTLTNKDWIRACCLRSKQYRFRAKFRYVLHHLC